MRLASFVVLLAMTMGSELRGSDDIRNRLVQRHADGCTITQLPGCNSTTLGRLASGDCTASDGTRTDFFSVMLPASQRVAVTLRPLSPSYTTPVMLVEPPASEFQSPPMVGGGAASTIWAKSFSGGVWKVAVGTFDLVAGGDYALHVDCFPGADSPRDCSYQELLCGQFVVGELTAESCQFGNSAKAFGGWEIYGVAGDTIDLLMDSTDFEPRFTIYDADRVPLVSSNRDSFRQASKKFRFPSTGWYLIAAFTDENGGGEYYLEATCAKSGCLFPYLKSPVPAQTVPFGSSATITLDLSVVGAFTAKLIEDPFTPPAATSTTATLVTPPITGPRSWLVEVENECGNDTSNIFAVMPVCSPLTLTAVSGNVTAKAGETVVLSASATGNGVSYFWYEGPVGDRSRQVGFGPTLTFTASSSQSYWVLVTDGCGNATQSGSIQVSAGGTRRRAARH